MGSLARSQNQMALINVSRQCSLYVLRRMIDICKFNGWTQARNGAHSGGTIRSGRQALAEMHRQFRFRGGLYPIFDRNCTSRWDDGVLHQEPNQGSVDLTALQCGRSGERDFPPQRSLSSQYELFPLSELLPHSQVYAFIGPRRVQDSSSI